MKSVWFEQGMSGQRVTSVRIWKPTNDSTLGYREDLCEEAISYQGTVFFQAPVEVV